MKTNKFDIVKELKTERDIDGFISAFIKEAEEADSFEQIIYALGIAAKAKGMLEIANEAGVNREQLYKSLSKKGNPSFKTIFNVAKSLGYKVSFEPVKK
jgi:probable addiction module antidote protein